MSRSGLYALFIPVLIAALGCASSAPREGNPGEENPSSRLEGTGAALESGSSFSAQGDGITRADGGGAREGPQGEPMYGPEFLVTAAEGDRVLARVDQEEIRISDIFQVFFMENPVKTRKAVEGIMLYTLVRREAGRLGIQAEGRKVEALLDRLLDEQRSRIAMDIDERATLEEIVVRYYGMDLASYRDRIRPTAVFQVLLERCVRYHQLQQRCLRLGAIVLKDRSEAERVRKKLERGASFEVMAKGDGEKPSDDRWGGILPPLPEDMDHPFLMSGLKLKGGEVSEVEETQTGEGVVYQIIKLVEVREAEKGTYRELRDKVEASLEEYSMELPDVIYWQDALRERYNLEVLLP